MKHNVGDKVILTGPSNWDEYEPDCLTRYKEYEVIDVRYTEWINGRGGTQFGIDIVILDDNNMLYDVDPSYVRARSEYIEELKECLHILKRQEQAIDKKRDFLGNQLKLMGVTTYE